MTALPITDAFTCVFGDMRGARGAEHDVVRGIDTPRASALVTSLKQQLSNYYYDDAIDIINEAGVHTLHIQMLKEALVAAKLRSFSQREPHILHDMWDASRLYCRPFTKVLVQPLADGSKKLHLHDYRTKDKFNPKDRMLCGYTAPHASMPSAPRGQWLHPFSDTVLCQACASHQEAGEWKECLDSEDYPVSPRLRIITPVLVKAFVKLMQDLFPAKGRSKPLTSAEVEGLGNWAWRGAVNSEMVYHVMTNPKQCDSIFESWLDKETYKKLCILYPGIIARTSLLDKGQWGMIYHKMTRSKYQDDGTMPKGWKEQMQAHLRGRIQELLDQAITS